MLAVIKTGGKQYKVKAKDKLKVGKLLAEEDKEVEFAEVLLLGDDKEIKLGNPTVKGAKVKAKVLKQGRHEKVEVVKYKNKTRYKRKLGHKQHFTEVEILSIS